MSWQRVGNVAVVLFLLCLAIPLESSLHVVAGTLTVTGPGDTIANDSVCTLREAITSANSNSSVDTCGTPVAGADTITFNLSPVAPIILTAGLPDIVEDLTIDGTSQPGYAGTPLITIDGASVNGVGGFRPFRVGSATSAVTLTVKGLTIQNGKSTGTSSGGSSGGAFLVSGGASAGNVLNIQDSIVQNNTAAGNGGVIFNQLNGTTHITHSTLSGNKSNTQGGAIQNVGTVTIDQSTISNNQTTNASSGNGGGIMLFQGSGTGHVTVTNSTITGNSAKSGGGGFDLEPSNILTIVNSTISGNTTPGVGGGILKNGGTLTVSASTITNNSASSGGGIESAGTLTLNNTIAAQNTGTTTHPDIEFGGGTTFTSGGNNVIGNATGTTGWVGSDQTGTTASPLSALLAPLGNYGGPTSTHALLPGSPAINKGADAICNQTGTGTVNQLDQRGVARSVNGVCDVGAFESYGFTLSNATGTPQQTVTNQPFVNGSGTPVPLGITVTANQAGAPFNEPVNGGQVTFTLPTSGASATFATTNGCVVTADCTIAPISGGVATTSTLTANGTAGSYTAQANAAGAPVDSPTASYALQNFAPITLSPASLPPGTNTGANGTVGAPYSQTLTATGGTGAAYTFSVSSGTLPPGITLNPTTGVLSGTPTAVGSGPYTFTVTVTDNSAFANNNTFTGQQTYTVTIAPASTSLTVANASAPLSASAQNIPLSATVTDGIPVNEGTVTFTVTQGATTIGSPVTSGTVTNGQASATFVLPAFTPTDGYTITAVYNPAATTPNFVTTSGTGTLTVTPAIVMTVAVAPASTTLKVGQTAQLTATATLSDATTRDVTSQVQWSSGNQNVVSVNAQGIATGVSPGGPVTVTASIGSNSGSASVSVTAPTAIGIAPAPAPASRPSGATSQPAAPPSAPASAPTGR